MGKQKVLELISQIVGMELWEILVGPLGIQIQLGKKLNNIASNCIEGEIAIVIQANIVIRSGEKTIYESLFPQDDDEIETFQKHFVGKVILDSRINERENSLHFLVKPNVTLNIYPWTKESEKRWVIVDHRIKNSPGIIVYSDVVEIVE